MERETYVEERKRLLAQREEADRLLEALDLLWEKRWSIGGVVQPYGPPAPRARPSLKDRARVPPKATHAIHETALGMPPDVSFGVAEIEARALETWPSLKVFRPTISGVLKKMAEEHDLRRVRIGKGRRPSIYRTTLPTEKEQKLYEDDG